MYIYRYASNTYPLPNFFKKIAYTFPYASASMYPIPFPCNIDHMCRKEKLGLFW